MSVSFFAFLRQAAADPALTITCVLLLAVVLVNGWTDAPNAIATVVSTGVLPFRRAVWLAAVCNLLGVVCVTALHPAVAETIYDIADFGPDTKAALTALCAALAAIVVWATLAWRLGIPTSESHALTAGVTGAAAALRGGLSNVREAAWGKVLAGLVLSVGLGYLLGRLALSALPERRRGYRAGQIFGAGAMAFLHGAQDGQKFMGVFLLGVALARGRQDTETFVVPLWLLLLCAVTMALGTAVGGKRIIDKVGRDMVPLDPRRGFAADLGGAGSLLLCTLTGLPVSTTHAKTAAILGAGEPGAADRGVVRSIALAWVLTFPGCALLGFLAAKAMLALFG